MAEENAAAAASAASADSAAAAAEASSTSTYQSVELKDIRDLPDTIQVVKYTDEKFPFLIDSDEAQMTRFFRYQNGTVLSAANMSHMDPENLRSKLVGCLKHGGFFVLDFAEFNVDLDTIFNEKSIPKEFLSRQEAFKEEVWSKLLRPEKGDPEPNDFIPRDEFALVIITKKDPPQESLADALKVMGVVRLVRAQDSAATSTTNGDNDELGSGIRSMAEMYGVSLAVRNSEDLVDAAFDGETDTVVELLEQGYSLESHDGHDNTPLSEACQQNHVGLVKMLLERGADPNHQNDQGKTPLFRAAFMGSEEVCKVLLESGADPDIKTKTAELPFMVAKTDEIRKMIEEWDREQTRVLLEKRKQIIREKVEENIKTAAGKEIYARQVIAKELVDKAKAGDVDGLKEQLEGLAWDAERHNEKRPRGSAQTRDEKGNTLLSVAVSFDKIDVAKMLLEKSKALPKDMELRTKTAEEKVWHSKINCRDAKGWTPICIAAFKKNAKMVELLLSHGADPRLPNQYNKTAFDFVRKKVDILNNVNDEGDPVIFEMLSRWDSVDATAEKLQHSVASNELGATAENDTTETSAGDQDDTAAEDGADAAAASDSNNSNKKGKKKGKKKKAAAGSGASAVKALNSASGADKASATSDPSKKGKKKDQKKGKKKKKKA